MELSVHERPNVFMGIRWRTPISMRKKRMEKSIPFENVEAVDANVTHSSNLEREKTNLGDSRANEFL